MKKSLKKKRSMTFSPKCVCVVVFCVCVCVVRQGDRPAQ